MHVLTTCKFEKVSINSNQDSVETSIFKKLKGSLLNSQICSKFELIQALKHILITCKNQKDRIENNQEKVETPISPL